MMEIPEALRLRAGDRTTIRLPGLGTAGYSWTAQSDDVAVATADELPPDAPSPSELRLAGKSVNARFEVVAHANGTTTIHFRQSRSFEPDRPPHRDVPVTVAVEP